MEDFDHRDRRNHRPSPPPRPHRRHKNQNDCSASASASSSTPSRACRHVRTKAATTTTIISDDKFECSGKSCAAATIADCVALCCCPCAVVNLLALALVKVPWTVGKRCLSAGKRRLRNRRKRKQKSLESETASDDGKSGVVYKGWWTEEGIMDISSSSEEDHEKVWSELCQLGNLGFGRVSSFTGITPQFN